MTGHPSAVYKDQPRQPLTVYCVDRRGRVVFRAKMPFKDLLYFGHCFKCARWRFRTGRIQLLSDP